MPRHSGLHGSGQTQQEAVANTREAITEHLEVRSELGMPLTGIRTAERIDDGSGINLGGIERTRVIDAHIILDILGRKPLIELYPETSTGPLNVNFREGVHRTIDWYVAFRNQQDAALALHRPVVERRERPAAS